MRHVRWVAFLAPAVVAVPGCVPDEPKPAEPAPAPVAPPVVPPPPPPQARWELKRDAWCALSMLGCGNSVNSPRHREAADRVWNAGPEIVPVLAELVPEGDFCLVRNAARIGADHPLSVELRTALRGRRDDKQLHQDSDWRTQLFGYFVKFGDETDLLWMEKAVGGLREEDRPGGEEHLRQLRARLTTN